MPALILPSGSPRWIELSSHNSFLSTLETFYDKHTRPIDDVWSNKLAALHAARIDKDIIIAVEQYIAKSFIAPQFTKFGYLIKGQLIDASISTWQRFIKALDSVPESIEVPLVLDKIAQLYHSERSGRTGKGEFLIPLLFNDAVWNSHEAIYDVTINNEHWHVKAIKRQSATAKLNQCGYANGPICKQLSHFMSASQLSAGMKSTGVLANLRNIRKLDMFSECMTDRECIVCFQQLIDNEMRALSIDGARGIIFYIENERRFVFRERNDVYCAGATQSNHNVTMQPNFFVNAYDKLLVSQQRAIDISKKRIKRQEAQHAREIKKASATQAKLAANAARTATKIRREQDNKHAALFFDILRSAWKLHRSVKTAAPSFTKHLEEFVITHSLDYQYFYSYLLDNSKCKVTFKKFMAQCK